ncbi:hypothetical protein UA18_02372 [Burkholderia multivorans]|uniref:Bacteriophage protein n=1 Tax=Burkholderia multivorans TaxID=87883 RepID=A0ABD7LJS8_9BURK|nr:hypothetical protein UA18_02372 [Burkholderia multivorans]
MEYFVAFTGSDEEKIGASFGCPQDPSAWPYQGVVTDNDPRWIAYAATFASGALTDFAQANSQVAPQEGQ